MRSLVRVVLAGTSRGGAPATGTPLDPVVAGVETSPERRLLLAAGAAAVYEQAGYMPRERAELLKAAPPDALSPCSPRAARMLRELFAQPSDGLLIEAMDLMRLARRRLPHDLLPLALDTVSPRLRPCLLPVLRERGRWLTGINPDWQWALVGSDATRPTMESERAWNEGSPEQRLSILGQVRTHDPALARQWLESVWKAEKAEPRVRLLGVLRLNLSREDEPFLETSLKNRSAGVRQCAAELLALLPGSALSERARSRADSILTYSPPSTEGLWSRARSLATGTGRIGRLTVRPPEAYIEEWRSDGIERKPPTGRGERDWWLGQILARIAPSHWNERFGADAEELIAAAAADSTWGGGVINGWADAAELHEDTSWLKALWSAHYRNPTRGAVSTRLVTLLRVLTVSAPQDAERLVMQALEERGREDDLPWKPMLEVLPTPWGTELGEAYLGVSRWRAGRAAKINSFADDPWLRSLVPSAQALPPTTFEPALRPWSLPKDGN